MGFNSFPSSPKPKQEVAAEAGTVEKNDSELTAEANEVFLKIKGTPENYGWNGEEGKAYLGELSDGFIAGSLSPVEDEAFRKYMSETLPEVTFSRPNVSSSNFGPRWKELWDSPNFRKFVEETSPEAMRATKGKYYSSAEAMSAAEG